MSLLIVNIKELLAVEEKPVLRLCGKEMSVLKSINNAYLLIENGIIAEYGSMGQLRYENINSINAENKMVLPCFCDSHTHTVFATYRENEFVDKIKGLSYEEIAKRGGGILNSAKKLNNSSEEELVESAYERIEEMIRFGTGAIEIKSGYGLTVENELKMLKVIRRLKEISPIRIKSTFLGAHSFPLEYKDNKKGYIDLIINKMLPEIGGEQLADYIDVFCEKGFFNVEETERIILAGLKYGLVPKIHANQLSFSGGVQLGVKLNAISVDHNEYTGDDEIKSLLNSNTIATLLPGASFFLNQEYAPARKMIDAGLSVSLASDYNPGSSPSGNMQFMLSLACIKMNMMPEEAINAATINAAYAMGISSEMGRIIVGNNANLLISRKIPSYQYLPYNFAHNNIEKVILNGELRY